ncbi:hypothetical protein PGB90_003117 [Kerria lacca]
MKHISSLIRRFISIENIKNLQYDVIVVGGGHAGTEASHAAARMGVQTLLLTHKKETIGEMSCNPSFGGIGKGHLMREIDALDGVCPRICDTSGIQYRILNRRKGPAVWGLRAQIDRSLYKKNIQEKMFNTPNLTIITGAVENLLLEEGTTGGIRCSGVILADGRKYYSNCVVLTTGTFLRANINIGLESKPAGRIGDEPAIGLADTLQKLKFKIGRLRTGTPPRLERNSINFENLKYVVGDKPPVPFSFLNETVWIKPEDQLRCYITLTNKTVEDICLNNLNMNRHVREEVKGPRYCPSIESKSIKFRGKNHIVWLEPEGLDTSVIYPGGLSCTMSGEMQEQMIHAIPGLEKAILIRPGYGVEYEFVNPTELTPALETKKIAGLFFAGQINGTTGYEEAAAQGIIAGINAAAKVIGKSEMVVSRTEAYIGVLIDDLTTLGTDEPYRMFTSRSEFRLLLRPDNADQRLTKKGYEIGCVSEERYKHFCQIDKELMEGLDILNSVEMSLYKWRKALGFNTTKCNGRNKAIDLFTMKPDVTIDMLEKTFPDEFKTISQKHSVRTRLEIEGIYSRTYDDHWDIIEEIRKDESIKIPMEIDYHSKIINLKFEEIEKLSVIQPQTVGAASRIPGVTPAGILRLMHYIKRTSENKTHISQ